MLDRNMESVALSRRNFIRLASLGLAGIVASLSSKKALADAQFSQNMNLTPEDIFNRTREIHDKYSVGDILSDADAEFVRLYGSNPNSRTTWSFSGSRYFNGATYQISGYKELTNTWSDVYSYGGTVQGGCATVTSNKITTYYSIMAYGLTGLSYEVIYQDRQHKECSGVNWCTHEYYGEFNGALSTQTIACWAEFEIDSGSFVVNEG